MVKCDVPVFWSDVSEFIISKIRSIIKWIWDRTFLNGQFDIGPCIMPNKPSSSTDSWSSTFISGISSFGSFRLIYFRHGPWSMQYGGKPEILSLDDWRVRQINQFRFFLYENKIIYNIYVWRGFVLVKDILSFFKDMNCNFSIKLKKYSQTHYNTVVSIERCIVNA